MSESWTIVEQGDANHYAILDVNGNWLLSFLHNGEATSASQKERIKLIASAPDLLEAVKKLVAIIGPPEKQTWATDDEVNLAFDVALAAIAKAEGGDS